MNQDRAVLEDDKTELQRRQQQDTVEIATLRKACQLQKRDIEGLEEKVKDLQVRRFPNPRWRLFF